MKNNILGFIICLYYLSLIVLLIIYLFPGSLIGYLLFEDLTKQLSLVENAYVSYDKLKPIGTTLNHFFYFFYLTFLGLIYNFKERKFINSILFLFVLSLFMELLHFFIPNRAFELNDLLANISGVVTVFFLFKIKKRLI